MSDMRLTTARLELVRVSPETARAAANDDRPRFGGLLNAVVAADWPHDLIDDALGPMADALERQPPTNGYTMWWVVLRDPRTLIGSVGLKSPPRDGRVDIGYGIVASHQRRGYAVEATNRLIALAFDDPATEKVVGETYAQLVPSIGVMIKCGFTQCAAGVVGFSGEENVVQFELTRQKWERQTCKATV
ncbi:MAG TPA: GNAT family N-acetyltransferase [Phycisphaerae bacterium]|nr:GNAT family N-acetyltransferase [Phycisphaerae bacterium]